MSYYESMRAEVARLRDEAAKWHNLLPVYEDAEREVQQLRADLREAMELIAQVNEDHMARDLDCVDRWIEARDALLAKHKETNQ